MDNVKMEDTMSQPLINKKEACKLINCSVRLLDDLRKTEGLPYIMVGGLVRFSRQHLAEWCQQREVNGKKGGNE